MQYVLSRRFEKDFSKLSKKTKDRAISHLSLFTKNPNNKTLRIHPLKGKWNGYFSIDVTSDIRAIYLVIEKDLVHFVAIGSHSKLYG